MRINFDRICKLAGIENNSSKQLNEAGNRSYHEDPGLAGDREAQFGQGYLNEMDHGADEGSEKEEGHYMEEGEDSEKEEGHHVEEGEYAEGHHVEEGEHAEGYHMEEGEYAEGHHDEMVEVDIGELMNEIRRAKAMINENKRKKKKHAMRKRKIQENHLKRIVAQEVQSILEEIEESDSGWVYGKRKPKHSRKGYTNQGRLIPGIGFGK